MKKKRIVLILPAETSYIPVVQNAVSVFAGQCGFADTEIAPIALAMEESYIYALEMGYEGVAGEIRVTLSSTNTGLKIEFHSRGLPLNPEQLPAYNPSKAMKSDDLRGLSFFLVKQLMDKVSFSVLRNGEREMTLLKRLPLRDGGNHRAREQPGQRSTVAEQKTGPESGILYHIRPAVPEDAEEIARVAMLSHGSILFSEDLYYPARVKEMIQFRHMNSMVAVTDEDTLFGHGALVPLGENGRVEELTYGFINPEFRGRDVISKIALSLLDDALNRRVYAVQALSVTSHIHSQKAVAKYGFIETALLLFTSTAASNWKKNEASEPDRIANLLQVKYLSHILSPTLFVPSRHRQIIQDIYAPLEGDIHFSEREQKPDDMPQEAKLLSESSLIEGWGFICVLEYGSGVEESVRNIVLEAIRLELVALHLLLPMDNEATPFFASLFEGKGFFFAGVGPGDDAKEYLALQYIIREDLSYDDIHVVGEMGQRIKDYVIECGKNAIKTYGTSNRQLSA